MTPTQAKNLKELCNLYRIPNNDKLELRIAQLSRIEKFYSEKIAGAPKEKELMIRGSVNALLYAMTMIKMYRKLTEEISAIAEELS